MDIVIAATRVDVATDGRNNLVLDIQGADLDDVINTPEGWDQVNIDDFLKHHNLEVKESE